MSLVRQGAKNLLKLRDAEKVRQAQEAKARKKRNSQRAQAEQNGYDFDDAAQRVANMDMA